MNWQPALHPTKALIQLDIEVDRIGRNYPVDIPLLGDAQTVLIELLYHAHRAMREGEQPGSRWANKPREVHATRYDDSELRSSDKTPLAPQRWRAELDQVLPDNAIVFSDIGGHMLHNLHHLCIRTGQRFVINLGFGSMGHGTVAPIGAALAAPERPVFALVGDGCFAMNGMDLLTAADNDIPVIWIVENNNMHGITWHCSAKLGAHRHMQAARYRRHLDVSAIARAMGVTAWVVDAPDQLQSAVQEALKLKLPALIDVRVDANVPPPMGQREKSLAGFIEK